MHRGQHHRQLAHDQFVAVAGGRQEVLGQHGQQVGLRHHAPGGEELVDGEHDAPLTAQPGQREVDIAVRPPREAHQQVVRRAEVVQRECPPGQRMALAHDADVARVVQARVAQRALVAQHQQLPHDLGKVAHGEIGRAVLEQAAWVARGQRQHAQVDGGGFALDAAHQRRRQHRRGGIGHGDAQLHGITPGVEVARRKGLSQPGQRRAHLRPQGLGAWRGPHST